LLLINTIFARNAGGALPVTKSFFFGVLVYLATISFVDEFNKIRKLINIFLFCNVFIAILGIKSGGLIRSIPALSDENDFALLMDMLIPFSFFYGLEAEGLAKNMFYFGITLLFVIGVFVWFSRGGFVGLICSGLYRLSKSRRRASIIPVALLVLVVGYLVLPQRYIREVSTIREGTEERTAAKDYIY
jgi:4-amino-4-deoxy-L-arabinose transferase-like glycosyltransferase